MKIIESIEQKNRVRSIITKDLTDCGLVTIKKREIKKQKSKEDNLRISGKVFGTSLLATNHKYIKEYGFVPKFLVDVVERLQKDYTFEGLFRKTGSNIRIREAKTKIDEGNPIPNDLSLIDLACLMKDFFRSLPEPLLPYHLHQPFLNCYLMTPQHCLENVLKICHLLSDVSLSTLAFTMNYLHKLTQHSDVNKMTSRNLAICFSINLLYPKPRDSKRGIIQMIHKPSNLKSPSLRISNPSFTSTCQSFVSKEDIDTATIIIDLLIRHAPLIGEIPSDVKDRLNQPNFYSSECHIDKWQSDEDINRKNTSSISKTPRLRALSPYRSVNVFRSKHAQSVDRGLKKNRNINNDDFFSKVKHTPKILQPSAKKNISSNICNNNTREDKDHDNVSRSIVKNEMCNVDDDIDGNSSMFWKPSKKRKAPLDATPLGLSNAKRALLIKNLPPTPFTPHLKNATSPEINFTQTNVHFTAIPKRSASLSKKERSSKSSMFSPKQSRMASGFSKLLRKLSNKKDRKLDLGDSQLSKKKVKSAFGNTKQSFFSKFYRGSSPSSSMISSLSSSSTFVRTSHNVGSECNVGAENIFNASTMVSDNDAFSLNNGNENNDDLVRVRLFGSDGSICYHVVKKGNDDNNGELDYDEEDITSYNNNENLLNTSDNSILITNKNEDDYEDNDSNASIGILDVNICEDDLDENTFLEIDKRSNKEQKGAQQKEGMSCDEKFTMMKAELGKLLEEAATLSSDVPNINEAYYKEDCDNTFDTTFINSHSNNKADTSQRESSVHYIKNRMASSINIGMRVVEQRRGRLNGSMTCGKSDDGSNTLRRGRPNTLKNGLKGFRSLGSEGHINFDIALRDSFVNDLPNKNDGDSKVDAVSNECDDDVFNKEVVAPKNNALKIVSTCPTQRNTGNDKLMNTPFKSLKEDLLDTSTMTLPEQDVSKFSIHAVCDKAQQSEHEEVKTAKREEVLNQKKHDSKPFDQIIEQKKKNESLSVDMKNMKTEDEDVMDTSLKAVQKMSAGLVAERKRKLEIYQGDEQPSNKMRSSSNGDLERFKRGRSGVLSVKSDKKYKSQPHLVISSNVKDLLDKSQTNINLNNKKVPKTISFRSKSSPPTSKKARLPISTRLPCMNFNLQHKDSVDLTKQTHMMDSQSTYEEPTPSLSGKVSEIEDMETDDPLLHLPPKPVTTPAKQTSEKEQKSGLLGCELKTSPLQETPCKLKLVSPLLTLKMSKCIETRQQFGTQAKTNQYSVRSVSQTKFPVKAVKMDTLVENEADGKRQLTPYRISKAPLRLNNNLNNINIADINKNNSKNKNKTEHSVKPFEIQDGPY